jgi:signal transduction histidine kinase
MQAFFTTKPVGAGMGIGLSTSRAIAEDHGGRLELRNYDGHTCFRLTLPVHAEKKEAAE